MTTAGSSRFPVLALVGRLLCRNLLSNGHSARFSNLWAGRRRALTFRRPSSTSRSAMSRIFESRKLLGSPRALFDLGCDAGAMAVIAAVLVGRLALTAWRLSSPES